MNDTHITIAAIVAMAQNGIIGADNKMLWHIPEDFKHYKTTTMGKPLIMGRKTFDSIVAQLGKPLPGRTSIVVTRRTDLESTNDVIYAPSLDEAIKTAKTIAARDGVDEIFINGGGEIYKAALPQTQRIYLTLVQKDYEGDTSFPVLDDNAWRETAHTAFPDNTPPFVIKILERIKN